MPLPTAASGERGYRQQRGEHWILVTPFVSHSTLVIVGRIKVSMSLVHVTPFTKITCHRHPPFTQCRRGRFRRERFGMERCHQFLSSVAIVGVSRQTGAVKKLSSH